MKARDVDVLFEAGIAHHAVRFLGHYSIRNDVWHKNPFSLDESGFGVVFVVMHHDAGDTEYLAGKQLRSRSMGDGEIWEGLQDRWHQLNNAHAVVQNP